MRNRTRTVSALPEDLPGEPDSPKRRRAFRWVELTSAVERCFAIDLRSLAAFRIALAGVLLADLGIRIRELEANYTDFGLLPRAAARELAPEAWRWSLHLLTGSWAGEAFLFFLAAVFGLCLLVGYRTRLSVVASWVLLVSLQNRNPELCYRKDALLVACVFWAMFVPLGEVFSVDAKRRRGRSPSPGARHFSVGTAALLLQVALMYWAAALLKTGPTWRQDGTAIYYALSLWEFVKPVGHWLLQYPALLGPLTFAVWYLELLGPFLLFLPVATARFRAVGILAFVGLQTGLFFTMELFYYPILSTVGLIPFLPSELWSRLRRARPADPREPAALRSPSAPVSGSSGALNAVAAFFLVFIVVSNVYSVARSPAPSPVRRIGELTRLKQDWGMFAPNPTIRGDWLVAPGKLVSGADADVFDGRIGPVSWTTPVSRTHLLAPMDIPHLPYVAGYLCRAWNRDHAGAERLQSLALHLVVNTTPPPGVPRDPKRQEVWSQRCD